MKINDKMRLDWLLDFDGATIREHWELMESQYYGGKYKTPRQAIDAAIRAERARRNRGPAK